jgi:hypothetical protein
MRSYRIQVLMLALAGSTLVGPALAQNAVAPPPAPTQDATSTPTPSVQTVPTPPDADESFLTGLRRVGVMAGQVVECSADTDKQAQISQAMELANKIAIHFGLKAAFNYVGALGYGSGHPFDKAGCAQAIDSWKQIQAKYLSK